MTTKTKAIRMLNDELRQNFTTGTAVMTAGVAALGPGTVMHIVKQLASTMTSVIPTTHAKRMTLVHSRSMATRSFLRSTILISRAATTRQTRLIHRSPSA